MPDLEENPAEVDRCHRSDGGGRCGRGGNFVFAAGGLADSRREQIREFTADLAKKTHDVAPLHDMPKKMVLAKDQIGDFYKDRFAGKDSELTPNSASWRPRTAFASRRRDTRKKIRRPRASCRLRLKEVFPETTCNSCASSIHWNARRCSLQSIASISQAKARDRCGYRSACTAICEEPE